MKLSIKLLPETVREMIERGARTIGQKKRRSVSVTVSGNVSLTEVCYDLMWSGGTRNKYAIHGITSSSVQILNPVEGKMISVPLNHILIKFCDFCGTVCDPEITVRNTDLFKLFGLPEVPAGMPAEVACDWLTEEVMAGNAVLSDEQEHDLNTIRSLCDLVTA